MNSKQMNKNEWKNQEKINLRMKYLYTSFYYIYIFIHFWWILLALWFFDIFLFYVYEKSVLHSISSLLYTLTRTIIKPVMYII